MRFNNTTQRPRPTKSSKRTNGDKASQNGHQSHTTTDASSGFDDVAFIYDNIPAELRERPQWVGVKLVHRTDASGEDIVIKKPIDPKPDMQARDAKSNDPDTWGTYQDACNMLPFCDGLGYMFAATDPHAGLDLDHCRDKATGAIADWAQPMIKRCGTYAEISQSGEGVKLIGLGAVPTGGHSRVYQSGKVEMYDDRRFFMLTGNHLSGTPTTISDITEPLAAIHREVWGSSGDNASDNASDANSIPRHGVELDARDRALFAKIVGSKPGAVFLALWSKRPTTDNANTSDEDAALVRRLAWWLNRDTARMDRWFRASARMRPKWDEIHYAAGDPYGQRYGQHLITLAVTEWVKPGDGFTGEDTADDFFVDDDAPSDDAGNGDGNGDKPFNAYYRLLTDDECETMPPAQGILGSILYEATVALLYGPSNRWKSFVALDWSLCIATGRNWLDHDRFPVRQGTVIYIAAEGARGLGKRIRAWKRAHGVTGRTRLRVLPHAVALLEEGTGTAFVQAVRAQLEDGDTPTLIVIDTLARSLVGGDENSTKDAELLMSKASRLREIFDCCVLFVHHTGYDTSHARGNTVFYNDADSVMTVAWNGDGGKPEPGDTESL